MKKMKQQILLIIGGIVGLFLFFVLAKMLNVEEVLFSTVKKYHHDVRLWVSNNYLYSVLVYIIGYSVVSLMPIPGDSSLTLMGGSLFGIWCGTLYSIIAITLAGSTIFLMVKRWYDPVYSIVAKNNVKKYGVYIALIVRIVPLLPMAVTNILVSCMPITFYTFIWTTAVGMIPIIVLYSSAGHHLNKVTSLGHVLSVPVVLMLISLAVLVCSPIIVKKMRVKKHT